MIQKIFQELPGWRFMEQNETMKKTLQSISLDSQRIIPGILLDSLMHRKHVKRYSSFLHTASPTFV